MNTYPPCVVGPGQLGQYKPGGQFGMAEGVPISKHVLYGKMGFNLASTAGGANIGGGGYNLTSTAAGGHYREGKWHVPSDWGIIKM